MAAGEEQSREYLRRHRLPELLHRLGALLLFHRPERPREFLIQVLERVKAGRRAEGEYPFLMDEANVEAMFSLLDVLGQGYIRPAQYAEALKTLGLSTEDLELENDENITLDVFKEGIYIVKGLANLSLTVSLCIGRVIKEDKDAGELVCVLV